MSMHRLPPLHDVDIKHLRLFKAVVECGGLSAAEEATGLGISAISKQLADLEARVGCQLCQRGRSGFALTSEGQVTYTATLRLLDAMDEFRDALGSAKGEVSGELSVWLIDHCTLTPGNPISAAIKVFVERYPHVCLNINVATPDLVERAVAEKRAALGITICKSNLPSLAYEVIAAENASLYCGKGHPAFNASAEQIRALAPEQMRYVRRGYLAKEMVPADMVEHSNTLSYHVEATVQLLLTGDFIGIVPDHIAQPWVERGELYRLPLPELMAKRPLFLVNREGRGIIRAADLLADLLHQAYRSRCQAID